MLLGGLSRPLGLLRDFRVLNDLRETALLDNQANRLVLALSLNCLQGRVELVDGRVSDKNWVKHFSDGVVDADHLQVGQLLDLHLDFGLRPDCVEKAAVSVRCELYLAGGLHENFALKVDGREHLLLEEDEVVFERSEVLLLLEKFNSVLVVLGGGHDEHLAVDVVR